MIGINTDIKRIGIFRALQLGDLLCMVPAVRAIRAAYPNAEISLLSLPWARGFVDRFDSYFDQFIHFPGYPGLPEQAFDSESYESFRSMMQHQHFDLLLQMQGNGTIVNEMMAGWNAKILAGFYPVGDRPPSAWFVEYRDTVHEIERHLQLLSHLGMKTAGTALEFPITAEDVASFRSLNLPYKQYRYVCIHAGSRGTYRQWPPELFAEAANLCYRMGFDIVLTGTRDELEIADRVAAGLSCPWFNACGSTTLGSAAQLIADAALLVSNCTGVAHVSAAIKTPSVIISMDGEPWRWGPLNKELHTTIDWLTTDDPRIVFNAIIGMLQRHRSLQHFRNRVEQ